MPWNEAIAVFREEEIAEGVNPITVRGWHRPPGVPAYRVVQILRARARAVHGDSGTLPAPEASMAKDPSYRKAWRELAAVYMARRTQPELWRKITADIAFAFGFIRKEEPFPVEVPPIVRARGTGRTTVQ